MKNRVRKSLSIIILFFALIIISCSPEPSQINDNRDLKKVGISEMKVISSNDPLVISFKESDYFKTLNVQKFGSLNLESVQLVSFTSLNHKMLDIQFNDSENAKLSLLAVYDIGKKEFIMSWIHEYSNDERTNSKTVNQYFPDGSKYLNVIAVNDRVVAVTSHSTKSSKQAKLGGSWSKCMEIAYNACASDWACGIMCGVAFEECVAATAIACALT